MTFVHHRASARNRDTPDKPRHYCRNLRCRAKLPTPVENEHHAFCCQGCHSSFYRSRCLVCEEPIRRKNERQRFGSGHKTCEQEYRRFPHVYDLPKHEPPQPPVRCTTGSRSAHSTGLKGGDRADRPPFNCLRGWCWGADGDRDHSLYDRDGLTVARLVLEGDGRYHLRAPLTWPRMAWSDLDEAERCAESLALCNLPLDPPRAARIKQDNSAPHPMGGPLLNRPWPVDDGSSDGVAIQTRCTTERLQERSA